MHKTARILLIDDDENVLKPYTDAFTAAGYEVVTASSVRDGMWMLDHKQPDIVLCDMRLNTDSGLELLSYRQHSDDNHTQRVPIIMMTELPDDDFASTALSLGAKDIVFKSYSDPRLVLTRVAKACS